MAVDTQTGKLVLPEEVHEIVKSEYPYKEWLKNNVVRLKSDINEEEAEVY